MGGIFGKILGRVAEEGAEIKIYSSLTEKFGEGYKSIAVSQGKYVKFDYGKNLNALSEGIWSKVYEAGILDNSKVEVHYFFNATTGEYANPYILTGKWASKAFGDLSQFHP